jgi:hypothetical protein
VGKGSDEEPTHDTRDGGTGWGAPGVVRVELRTYGEPNLRVNSTARSVADRTIVVVGR